MTSRIIVVDPFDYIVFGATGDLAKRKLMPSLYHRDADGQIPSDARIIGAARSTFSSDDFRAEVKRALESYVGKDLESAALERFLARIHYVPIDAKGTGGWDDLKTLLDEHPERIRAFYLSTTPELFGPICENIASHGLRNPETRVVVEKPLGKDLKSAQEINDAVGRVFDERSIYRIDHYLGKETVQNLMALRFANTLFGSVWDAAHIDHVQITAAETIGVEGRGDYYDTSGALRDMVQNHLLQLLCLTAMEPPSHMGADDVRDEKLKVLRALKPIDASNVHLVTVKGQYRANSIAGITIPGYLDEISNKTSMTETFAALKVEIANWRWAGVPFYIRTGKRLPKRMTEIVICFKPIAHSIFDSTVGHISRNRLIIRVQPDEGMTLEVMIKDPGLGGMRLSKAPLDMTFAEQFGGHSPDAYERLLLDVVRGNATLFMRRDEVEAAWRWVDPILESWGTHREPPKAYPAGTWGPAAAENLIARDNRSWYEAPY
jgi:glucose-6-phosphate 1-dehydrogenase